MFSRVITSTTEGVSRSVRLISEPVTSTFSGVEVVWAEAKEQTTTDAVAMAVSLSVFKIIPDGGVKV